MDFDDWFGIQSCLTQRTLPTFLESVEVAIGAWGLSRYES